MDEMKALYLIVEGKTDAAILHTLLDCRKFHKVYHIPTGGYGNISSVARTIRLMRSPVDSNDKIIIVSLHKLTANRSQYRLLSVIRCESRCAIAAICRTTACLMFSV